MVKSSHKRYDVPVNILLLVIYGQLWLGLEAKHFKNMQTAAFGDFISATRVKGL